MNSAFAERFRSLQWAVVLINVVVVAIGGTNFGLSVASRPILRITKVQYFSQVQSICDLIVATGIIQIVVAGYDIFAANWKLVKPLYLGIGLTFVAMLLEIVAICTASYLYNESDVIATENPLQPWFVMECLPHGSCKKGLEFYTTYFMMPQVGLSILSIILHCLSILYLFKLLRTINEKRMVIWKAKAKDKGREDVHTNLTGAMELTHLDHNENVYGEAALLDSDDELLDSDTPKSILKEEHGYVSAGAALDKDYDDTNVIRNRVKQVGFKIFVTTPENKLVPMQESSL